MAKMSKLVGVAGRILRSEQGKQAGARALQGAAAAADRATKGRRSEQIEKARQAAEKGLRRL